MDYVCYGIRELYETHYADEERFVLIEAGNPDVSGIDMDNYSFRATYSKSTSDTNHLNKKGMELMRRFMRRELSALFEEK